MEETKTNFTLLCITSDAEVKVNVEKILNQNYSNHNFVYASDGIEAVISIEAHTPDLFILDFEMPTYDRALVIKEIVSLNKIDTTIGISTRSEETTSRLPYNVAKPIKSEEFCLELNRMIKTLNFPVDVFAQARASFFC